MGCQVISAYVGTLAAHGMNIEVVTHNSLCWEEIQPVKGVTEGRNLLVLQAHCLHYLPLILEATGFRCDLRLHNSPLRPIVRACKSNCLKASKDNKRYSKEQAASSHLLAFMFGGLRSQLRHSCSLWLLLDWLWRKLGWATVQLHLTLQLVSAGLACSAIRQTSRCSQV